MLTAVLRSTGDKTRDVLRIRRIHGLVAATPGNDRFAIHVFERGRGYLMEFPNITVGLTKEIIEKLVGLHRALLGNNQQAELLLAQGLAEIARAAARR